MVACFLCAKNRMHLLGSSQLGSVVNNHGDRKSPKDRVVIHPFQMAELDGLEMEVPKY